MSQENLEKFMSVQQDPSLQQKLAAAPDKGELNESELDESELDAVAGGFLDDLMAVDAAKEAMDAARMMEMMERKGRDIANGLI